MRSRHVARMQHRAQLLGPDGAPIQAKQEIPFIQWLPDGKSTGRSVDRGAEMYAQAVRFIARGGRYAFLIRPGDMGELVAGFPVEGGAKGEMIVVAQEIVANGPAVSAAIDRLVIASVANMENSEVSRGCQVARAEVAARLEEQLRPAKEDHARRVREGQAKSPKFQAHLARLAARRAEATQ